MSADKQASKWTLHVQLPSVPTTEIASIRREVPAAWNHFLRPVGVLRLNLTPLETVEMECVFGDITPMVNIDTGELLADEPTVVNADKPEQPR